MSNMLSEGIFSKPKFWSYVPKLFLPQFLHFWKWQLFPVVQLDFET
jgi:hypothetical protein